MFRSIFEIESFSKILIPTCKNSIYTVFYVQRVICWKVIFFLDVTPFNSEDGYRRFGGTFWRGVNANKSAKQHFYVFFPGLPTKTHTEWRLTDGLCYAEFKSFGQVFRPVAWITGANYTATLRPYNRPLIHHEENKMFSIIRQKVKEPSKQNSNKCGT
jgi:hypothetical protein